MTRLFGRFGPPTLSAWLFLIGSAPAAEPRAARLVPPNTAIYVEVPDPTVLIDRVKGGGPRAILAAVPAYRKAVEGPQLAGASLAAGAIAFQVGTTPEAGLRSLTKGGMALAIEGPNQAVLTITPTDPALLDRAHARFLAMARDDATKKGKPDPIKEADYKGIHGWSFSDKEAHAIIDGTLVVATGGDMLKRVIDRIKDGVPGGSLADNAEFAARRAAAPKDGAAWMFARLDRLRELDPKRFGKPATPDTGQTLLFGPWAELLRTAPWISMSLGWTERQLGLDVTLPTPAGGYPKALARYIPPAGAGAAAPLKVPGLIATLSLWRDLAAVWEVRGELFPPEAQQGFAQLDTFAGQFFGGRDFATGVLGAVESRWNLVIARQDDKALNPRPEVVLPAFALIIDLKPGDPEFAQRLQAAFQSFIGLSNLGAAQMKAPPLMIGSERFEGVTIATSSYSPPIGPAKAEPANRRHNYSPSAAQVGDRFVISSSVGLARSLVTAIATPPGPATELSLVAEADGESLAGLIEQNKARLVEQNMLEKGNDQAAAEGEVGLLSGLVRYLGRAGLSVQDAPDALRVHLKFDLNPPGESRP